MLSDDRQAEMMELKASRSRDAEAVVVEARLVQGQGPVATVVAKRGTLRPGLPIVVGNEWGKVGHDCMSVMLPICCASVPAEEQSHTNVAVLFALP